jgi:hypothetical protein
MATGGAGIGFERERHGDVSCYRGASAARTRTDEYNNTRCARAPANDQVTIARASCRGNSDRAACTSTRNCATPSTDTLECTPRSAPHLA